MNSNPQIFVLLPVYNEELGLHNFITSVIDFLKTDNLSFQIVICNDGSTDSTQAILDELARKNSAITVLQHTINRGLGETVRTLFEYSAKITSEDDLIIRMDCDSTHEARYIHHIVDRLLMGYDLVIASRFQKGGGQIGVPRRRIFLSLVANKVFKLVFPIGPGVNEYTSGFRGYRASLIKQAIGLYRNDFIQLKSFGFACTVEKLIKLSLLGARISEVPFTLRYDKKQNDSKMVANITSFGYLILAVLYHWPRTGWKRK